MNPFEFQIAVRDFDLSLLPVDARVAGSDAFRLAVADFYRKQFANGGGGG